MIEQEKRIGSATQLRGVTSCWSYPPYKAQTPLTTLRGWSSRESFELLQVSNWTISFHVDIGMKH